MLATPQEAAKLTDSIPDEITDFSLVWGGPERVAKRIQEMIDAGINEVSFFNMAAAADPEYGANWQPQIAEVVQPLGGKLSRDAAVAS